MEDEYSVDELSPCKSSGTATLLLEAALRIHKHSSSSNHKTKTIGFGLFGSLFKRIKQRNQNRKREINNENVSVKDILNSKKIDSHQHKTCKNRTLAPNTQNSITSSNSRFKFQTSNFKLQ
ncbi:hypothetical protein RYX36_007623, partial [Vicia faba]